MSDKPITEVTQAELAEAIEAAKDILNGVQAGSKTLAKQRHRLVARALLSLAAAPAPGMEYRGRGEWLSCLTNTWGEIQPLVGKRSTRAEVQADLDKLAEQYPERTRNVVIESRTKAGEWVPVKETETNGN